MSTEQWSAARFEEIVRSKGFTPKPDLYTSTHWVMATPGEGNVPVLIAGSCDKTIVIGRRLIDARTSVREKAKRQAQAQAQAQTRQRPRPVPQAQTPVPPVGGGGEVQQERAVPTAEASLRARVAELEEQVGACLQALALPRPRTEADQILLDLFAPSAYRWRCGHRMPALGGGDCHRRAYSVTEAQAQQRNLMAALFQCKTCGVASANQFQHAAHLMKCNLKCQKCGKSFGTKHGLQIHQRSCL